jgi:Bacterial extracellular solute-binding protein
MAVRKDHGPVLGRRSDRRPAAIVGVLALGVVAVASACSAGRPASAACSPLSVTVVAAPQIAPAVADVASGYNSAHPKPGGHCVTVRVKQADPAQEASSLSGQGVIATPSSPDAWIPDSTLWVDQARITAAGASRVAATGTSLAISPIVLALPRAVARQFAAAVHAPSWKMLIPTSLPTNTPGSGSPATQATTATTAAPATTAAAVAGAAGAAGALQLKVLDPATNATGMASLLAMRSVSGHGPAGLVTFVTVARVSQFLAEPDNNALFKAMLSASQPTGGLTSEQAVWAHNNTDSSHPVTAVYLSEGSPMLDFPYVVTTKNSAKRLALADFAKAMRAPAGQQAIQSQGLRTPDGAAMFGFGPSSGVATEPPAALPMPSVTVVDAVSQMWARILIGVRMLIALDESPSMGNLVEGTNITRLQAIQELSVQGISLFNRNDVIGLWTFDTGLADPFNYRVVLPMRPLNQQLTVPSATGATVTATQRQLLLAAMAAQRPQVDTVTALYETIRSAYQEVSRGYIPDRFNGLIVDTDGTNFDPRPHPLSLDQLLATLRSEFNPQRPVNILIIGYGHHFDLASMTKIANVTNGAVYDATSPAGIEKFYLQMLTRLVCNDNCPLP